MTKLLDKAVAAARLLSTETQDAIARFMLEAVHDLPQATIPAEDIEAVEQGLAEADRGAFATEAEIEAAFRRFYEPSFG